MPVGAVAVAGGTALAGMYSANKAASAQKQAMNAQDQALEDQVQLGQDQLTFSKQQYADWQKNFQPSIGLLSAMAQQQIHPDYSQINADVGGSFDTSQAINNRNMMRYGVAPTDGAYQASQTQYGLGRALATVMGDQQARQNATQQQWNRLSGFVGAGLGQQNSLLGSQQAATNGLMGAYGNQASLYGQRAGMYANSAAQGAGLFGSGLSMFGSSGWFSPGGMFGSAIPVASADIPAV